LPLLQAAQSPWITPGGNAITVLGTGTVTLDANGAASDLLVNDGILSVNGAITLTADNDVIFEATGDIASTAGAVSVRADADNGGTSSGALTMVDGTVINAGSGTIALLADENITLGQVTTTNTGATAVTLTSTEGGIVGGDTGGADVITAGGRLVIDAVTGVGSGARLRRRSRVSTLIMRPVAISKLLRPMQSRCSKRCRARRVIL